MYIQMYERKEIVPYVEGKERMLRFVLTGVINFMWLIFTKPSYMDNLHYVVVHLDFSFDYTS